MERMGFPEKDWKLFRSRVSGWQEAYMDRLNKEYIELLSGEGNASDMLMLSWVVMISPCHAVMRLPGYLSWNVPFDGAAVRPITKGISSYIHALPAL